MNTDQINKYCDKAITNATNIKLLVDELSKFIDVNFSNVKDSWITLNGNLQNSPTVDIGIVMDGYRIRLKTVKHNTRFNFEYSMDMEYNYWGSDEYREYRPISNEFYSLYKDLTIEEVKKLCLDFNKPMKLKEVSLLMKQKIKEYRIAKDFK